MKQNVALSILTPFSSKSAKKWEGAAQKTESDEGGPRGSGNYYFMVLFEFCTFSYQCWSRCTYFWGQGIHFSRFWKNSLFCFFRKRLFYPRGTRLSCEGAFVAARETLSIFMFCKCRMKDRPFRSTFWKFEHFTPICLAVAATWV